MMSNKIITLEPKRQRECWLDCLKFIAIMAVFVDHARMFGLYTNDIIAFLSFFSVSLFVFIGGINSFYSEQHNCETSYFKHISRKCTPLLEAYIVGTLLILLYETRKLELIPILDNLVHFTASPVFYFVLFYLQLILISRLLYCFIISFKTSKYPRILLFLSVIIVIAISAFCIRYTYILPVHGGGQYLFGGTYLFVFYCGMLWAAFRKVNEYSAKRILTNLLVSFILLCLWVLLIIKKGFWLDQKIKYFGSTNPPGLTLIIFAFLIFAFVASLDVAVNTFKIKWLKRTEEIIGWFGQHTLYFFILHLLILDILKNSIFENLISNIWVKRFFYIFAVWVISIGIEYSYKFFKKSVVNVVKQQTNVNR